MADQITTCHISSIDRKKWLPPSYRCILCSSSPYSYLFTFQCLKGLNIKSFM